MNLTHAYLGDNKLKRFAVEQVIEIANRTDNESDFMYQLCGIYGKTVSLWVKPV